MLLKMQETYLFIICWKPQLLKKIFSDSAESPAAKLIILLVRGKPDWIYFCMIKTIDIFQNIFISRTMDFKNSVWFASQSDYNPEWEANGDRIVQRNNSNRHIFENRLLYGLLIRIWYLAYLWKKVNFKGKRTLIDLLG